MVDRRRGTESPSSLPPSPISPPMAVSQRRSDEGTFLLIRRDNFSPWLGWLKGGRGDDFRVRACSRSVRRMDAGIRIRMRRNGPRPFHPPTLLHPFSSASVSLPRSPRYDPAWNAERSHEPRRNTRVPRVLHNASSHSRVACVQPDYGQVRASSLCVLSFIPLGEREKLEEGGEVDDHRS